METKAKRVRGTNFLPEEKLLCLNLVKKYSHIIENKKTDGLTWRKKYETWTKIANEFNAQNSEVTFRSKEALKRFFENKKKETRKAAAAEKTEFLKTGGGTAVPIVQDPTFDLTMSILNKKTVWGFQGICDGDQSPSSSCRDQARVTTVSAVPEMSPTRSVTEEESEDKGAEEQIQENPIHLPRTTKHPQNTQKWSRRRRPTLCPTGNVAKKYEDLGEIKLQVAKVQLELLKSEQEHQLQKFQKEMEAVDNKKKRDEEEYETKRRMENEEYERRRRHKEEEFELRKKILELDIKLKEAQLKALGSF